MVEQWTENPCVPGSIPGGTTKNIRNTLDYQDITDFLFLLMYDYCSEKVIPIVILIPIDILNSYIKPFGIKQKRPFKIYERS
jgi:hypothetical protein